MQGYGSIAFRTPTLDNPAYPSLILAQNLIASGRLSLARKIRKELKLVYSVTPVLHCEDKFGYLNILFDCAPDKVQTTIQETMKVLQNFKPTEEEIQQTKNTFVQHNLRAQDSPFVLFERFINEDKFNFSYNDLERRVISQTLSQVTDAFSRYLLEQPKQVTLLAPSF
jgi:predicted Zn-dependent peptidase